MMNLCEPAVLCILETFFKANFTCFLIVISAICCYPLTLLLLSHRGIGCPSNLISICFHDKETIFSCRSCDKCYEWFHGDCIGITERDAKNIRKYFCQVSLVQCVA